MDTSKAATRRSKITTALEDLKSRENLNGQEKNLLNMLLPFEKAKDEKLLKITDEEWAEVFPERRESSAEPGKYPV